MASLFFQVEMCDVEEDASAETIREEIERFLNAYYMYSLILVEHVEGE